MSDDSVTETEIGEGGADEGDSQHLIEVHERAMRRFDSVALPQQWMRQQSLEARRFRTVPGAQWEGPFEEQFENTPRPEVDKITKPRDKIYTDYIENRIMSDFVPANDAADEDTAELLDGLYRADVETYQAMQAYDNAFSEGLDGGFGAWRLATDLADPDDPDNESQRVNPGIPIVDADQSVYFDTGDKTYNKHKAQWAFIISANPRAEDIEKWGAGNIADWPIVNWRWQWQWYAPDVVYTAEYYEKEKVDDVRVTLTNGLTGETLTLWASDADDGELADLIAQGWKKSEKKAKRTRVHKYVMNGTKVLKDCKFIAGDMIPIVPFYYRREYVDNMERWSGFVQKLMDPQRILNASTAKMLETQALAPYEVPIVTPEQIAGYVGTKTIPEHWAEGNISRLPFRVLLPATDGNGQIVSQGPIGKIEPPQVQPADAALLQFSVQMLSDAEQNADQPVANTSFKTMDLVASRIDARSAMPLDFMRQSMERSSTIYEAQASCVYFEKDRKVDTVTVEGQDGTATLHEPVIDARGVFKIRNDLARGKYKVVATVQEATDTKRQRTVNQCLALAETAAKAGDPEMASIYFLKAAMNMDGEGQSDIAEHARKKLLGMGIGTPTKEEQQALTEQAQQPQQPDPAMLELQAKIAELESKAKVNEATAMEKQASAGLKVAQAGVVGGPVSEPDTPTGLDDPAHPKNVIDMTERLASADLKTAQAEHLREGMHHQRIKTGAELTQAEHDRELARRQQDLAERTA